MVKFDTIAMHFSYKNLHFKRKKNTYTQVQTLKCASIQIWNNCKQIDDHKTRYNIVTTTIKALRRQWKLIFESENQWEWTV